MPGEVLGHALEEASHEVAQFGGMLLGGQEHRLGRLERVHERQQRQHRGMRRHGLQSVELVQSLDEGLREAQVVLGIDLAHFSMVPSALAPRLQLRPDGLALVVFQGGPG